MNRRWLVRKTHRFLESVGLRKKPVFDTPWQRVESSHIKKSSYLEQLIKGAHAARRFGAELVKPPSSPFSAAVDEYVQGYKDRFQEFDDKMMRQAGTRTTPTHSVGEKQAQAIQALRERQYREAAQVISHIETGDAVFHRMSPSKKEVAFLQKLVCDHQASAILEFGTNLHAYSALCMAQARPEAIVVTVEESSYFAGHAKAIAGHVQDARVKVVNDDSTSFIVKYDGPTFDFVFFDHSPMVFMTDLQKLLACGLIGRNGILAVRTQSAVASEWSTLLSYITRHPKFRPLHGPPTSPLYVYKYIG
ncbi:hypothetical protein DIPPA_31034 [Diplonema papillatum]|nr:hypothetical protein DIPPA_31034 [Diplonema papillatum]|eukprot:gene10763-16575_t